MIGFLRGRAVDRRLTPVGGDLLLETQGGVGYRVIVAASTFNELSDQTDEVTLFTYTYVREDTLALYGFGRQDECRAFEAILGAHGVGPTLALSILSAFAPHDLHAILVTDDIDALCTIPGVGRKTAARLLPELKAKLDLDSLIIDVRDLPSGQDRTSAPSTVAEVRAALNQLGYSAAEIRASLAGLDNDSSVEEMLKQALRNLAVSR